MGTGKLSVLRIIKQLQIYANSCALSCFWGMEFTTIYYITPSEPDGMSLLNDGHMSNKAGVEQQL